MRSELEYDTCSDRLVVLFRFQDRHFELLFEDLSELTLDKTVRVRQEGNKNIVIDEKG